MHLQRLTIENLRSICSIELRPKRADSAGWRVILGDNGAGESNVVRALALVVREVVSAPEGWVVHGRRPEGRTRAVTR